MQWGFYFDQTRCTGCFTCVVACRDWHDVPAGPSSWIRVSGIQRGKYPDLFAAYLCIPCYHCLEPACIPACPAGAIAKRQQDGIVIVDAERCLGKDGCGLCLEACPYDAPQFREAENATMEKCDLCLERLAEGKNTICVEACPMRALDVGPIEDLTAKYGNENEATGFAYSTECKPSVVFRAKRKDSNRLAK